MRPPEYRITRAPNGLVVAVCRRCGATHSSHHGPAIRQWQRGHECPPPDQEAA